jgi:dipeptidyl aminopeptidase/acylaminoacyl peptidase
MIPDLSFRRVSDRPEQAGWYNLRPGNSPGTFVVEGFQLQESGSSKTGPARQYRRVGQQWIEDEAYVERSSAAQIRISEATDRWPKLVNIDPATQKEAVILDPNPQFRNLRFGREEIIRWTGNLGEPQVGGLLYPPDYTAGKKYPLVIQTYVLVENAFLLDGPMTTAYAAQAIVNHDVFLLQLPHGSLYSKTVGTPNFGKAELSQIDSAVDYLDNLGLVDTQLVGLIGFSMKGYQVTYALAHSKHHFAAATSAEGNDWGYWSYVEGGNSARWATQSEAAYGGPPWSGNWSKWMEESITFNFDKIHTPLRLESDMNDYGAVIAEWEKFIALKRLRRPVELIYVSHGFHPVVRPWDRMTSQQGNVDWLMFWLKGEEDRDPAKAEQYTRWHELRKLQENDNANPGKTLQRIDSK